MILKTHKTVLNFYKPKTKNHKPKTKNDRKHRLVLIEGPGPSDRRDPEDVISQVALNVSSHIAYVYGGNTSKDLLLISQGDPPDTKGISAVNNLVAARLNINKCGLLGRGY